MLVEEFKEKNLQFLNELCSWLSHQKGMIPQSYAKDLAVCIIYIKKNLN